MALKATIFKAELQVSDLDRGYFATHSLTLARHPSETDERMMVRVLGFALYASEYLQFGRGLSTEDEADLWEFDATGQIVRWIDVGLPEEKLLRKACQRAQAVSLLAYGGRAAEIWWQKNAGGLSAFGNLSVLAIEPIHSQALAQLAARTMRLNCTIQDGQIWFGNDTQQVDFSLTAWLP